MTNTITTSWAGADAPGVRAVTYPQSTLRAMRNACRAVDQDIEKTGTVSVETVDAVRAALEQMRQHDKANDPMRVEAWTPEFIGLLCGARP